MYIVKFKFMVGSLVYDLISGKKAKLIGTFYGNGQSLTSETKLFHRITYCIEIDGERFARDEEHLIQIQK